MPVDWELLQGLDELAPDWSAYDVRENRLIGSREMHPGDLYKPKKLDD